MAINFFGECVLCAGQFVSVLLGASKCHYFLLYHHMEECGEPKHTRWIFGIQKYTRYNQQEPSQSHQNGIRGYHHVCTVLAATLLHFLYRKVSWWYFVRWTRSRWLVFIYTCVSVCIRFWLITLTCFLFLSFFHHHHHHSPRSDLLFGSNSAMVRI